MGSLLKEFYLFIFGRAGSFLLCRLFSSCSEQGLLSSRGTQASHGGGFSRWGSKEMIKEGMKNMGETKKN